MNSQTITRGKTNGFNMRECILAQFRLIVEEKFCALLLAVVCVIGNGSIINGESNNPSIIGIIATC